MLSVLSKDMTGGPSDRPMQSLAAMENIEDDCRAWKSDFKTYRSSIGESVNLAVPGANTFAFRQGKVAELRLELNNGGKKDKNHSAKKIALKKIVANMTMSNNDMVALFPDVVGCMQIPSLEIKKMYVLFRGMHTCGLLTT